MTSQSRIRWVVIVGLCLVAGFMLVAEDADKPKAESENSQPALKVSDSAGDIEGEDEDAENEDSATGSKTNEVTSVADDPNFARYKTIMDRLPFGPEPVNFNPDAPGLGISGGAGVDGEVSAEQAAAEQETERVFATVRVSAINGTPSGLIAVGFTDSSQQPVKNYYLKVGEKCDGWTVKDADISTNAMTVTLVRDDLEKTFRLGEGTQDTGKAGSKRTVVGGGIRNGAMPPPSANDAGSSLRSNRARRRALQQEEAERMAAAAAAAKADREKAQEERKQAEAERQAQREQQEAERQAQREQLMTIQEELRRQREERKQQEEARQAEEQPPEGEPPPPPPEEN